MVTEEQGPRVREEQVRAAADAGRASARRGGCLSHALLVQFKERERWGT